LKKIQAGNAVRYKKYYLSDPRAERARCVAMYRQGCRVYGDARTKLYKAAKKCLAGFNNWNQAKNNYAGSKRYLTYAQRTMKYKRRAYTQYSKRAATYLAYCKRYSK